VQFGGRTGMGIPCESIYVQMMERDGKKRFS